MPSTTDTLTSLPSFRHRGKPRRAAPSSLKPEMSSARALACQLSDCAKMIERNALVMMLSDAPEGPHQFRVGLRRLRAALKAFRNLLDPARRKSSTPGPVILGGPLRNGATPTSPSWIYSNQPRRPV